MSEEPKETLHGYLRVARQGLIAKLDGLSEHDVRRPLTPTGTNLFGLAKHVCSVGAGYFGEVMGRDLAEPMPWFDEGAEINADLRAGPGETTEWLVDFWDRCWAHADETIEALPLDATGQVPWWGEAGEDVTLRTLLVHMIAEVNRHAGHADILRELIDGTVGLREEGDNIGEPPAGWESFRAAVQSDADRYA